MAVLLKTLIILTVITGIYSIKTVSHVSVKGGAPVTIPCLYESIYRNHVKYLCKGKTWNFCTYEIKTNTLQNSQKYSISDDKNQAIFTVTIKDQADKNIYYWCALEIQKDFDHKQYFYLSDATGTPGLYVDNQTVTGFIGEYITINCYYGISGEMKWCKLNSNCVSKESGLIDGTRVKLNKSLKNVFSVTLSGLSPESSGWYYCVKGDFQMPVHLTVTEKPTVVATVVTATEIGTFTIQGQTTICVENEPIRFSANLNGLIISLSLLIIIGTVVLFIWFKIRHKHAREDSTTTKSSEEEVTYSGVHFKKTKAAQGLSTDKDAGVIYSCVVNAKQ